ncbi:MAG: glycosyltransferase family 4 protein [candidate division WOR-3 bacterium]
MGRKIRVCFLTSSHPTDYTRFLDREARSLKIAGYDVTIIGLGRESGIHYQDGIKLISVKEHQGVRKVLTLKEIARIAIEQRADIYHCCDPWCLGIGFLIKRHRPKVKIVYESCEWFPQMYLDRNDFPLPLRLLGWLVVTCLEYRATKNADEIIETNPLRARRFQRRGRRARQVPNYAPLELVKEPLNKREPWFVYTGLICRPRGFDRLLKALTMVKPRFPNVRLLVRGEFDPRDDIETWAKGFIRENHLEENVRFLERVDSYAKVFEIIRPCLGGVILLQPKRGNDWTNQPSKLFEFMLAGLAVVASNFPEIARIVNDARCGWLVDPTRPDAIAAALNQVLENPEEAIRRGLAGRGAAESKYNWQNAEKVLMEIYERLSG